MGWNSRYDQWYDTGDKSIKFKVENDNIETSKKPAASKNNSKKSNQLSETSSKSPELSVGVENKYAIGSKISAKWIDNNFYPGEVTKHLMKSSILYYEVKFFDGIKKLIRFNYVRDINEEESLLYFNSISNVQQEIKAIEKSPDQELKSESLILVNDKQEESRRAEAELLLAIQKPHIKEEITTTKTETLAESSDQPVISNDIRKSSRVKRLKTFKDEIVFYSPSSLVGSLDVSTNQELANPFNNKKRKLISTSDIPVNDQEIDMIETDKSTGSNETDVKKMNVNQKLKSNKNQQSKLSLKKIQEIKKVKLQKQMLKKSKQKLIQKLIETSQLTLKKQQELLEKQMKRHQHMKLKKKMLKILRKQNQNQPAFASFFPTPNQPGNILNLTQPTITNQFNMNMNNFLFIDEPIRCNFSNCDKTFRKQSLLEYHLKYHHYVDVNLFNNFNSNQQQQFNNQLNNLKNKKVKSRQNSSTDKQESVETENKNTITNNNNDNNEIIDSDYLLFENELAEKDNDNDDPYDVVHCNCGNHRSDGFMIQCEVCLCWQHRVCLNMHTDNSVPDHHLCWVCSEPGNKLKKLKYQNWMQLKAEKIFEKTNNKQPKNKLKTESILKIDDPNQQRLKLLNLCSKKYFNLNLLMYTLEYQTSLLNKMTIKNQNENNLNEENSIKEKIEKLTINIEHLQSCAIRKFDDFNQKLDGK